MSGEINLLANLQTQGRITGCMQGVCHHSVGLGFAYARAGLAEPRAPPSADKWGGAAGGGGGWGGAAGKTQRPSKPTGEKPEGCTELFCGNLSWSIDEEKVKAFFKKAGATVVGTRWLNDKESGEFKGIGFVEFADTADVDKAVGLGGEALDGRPIRIDYAGQKKKEGAWQGNSW